MSRQLGTHDLLLSKFFSESRMPSDIKSYTQNSYAELDFAETQSFITIKGWRLLCLSSTQFCDCKSKFRSVPRSRVAFPQVPDIF